MTLGGDVGIASKAARSLDPNPARHTAAEHKAVVQVSLQPGTGPRGGEGMTFTELSPDELADPVALLQGRR